ncbi:MAG: hypothetical protein R3C14_54975 [Caldilineaceae bacterium]
MALLIDLPLTLEHQVKAEAEKQKRTPEQIVIEQLAQTLILMLVIVTTSQPQIIKRCFTAKYFRQYNDQAPIAVRYITQA